MPPSPSLTHVCVAWAPLQSVTDKLKEKLDAADKEKVEKAVQEALDWMDENQVGAARPPPSGCCTCFGGCRAICVPGGYRAP